MRTKGRTINYTICIILDVLLLAYGLYKTISQGQYVLAALWLLVCYFAIRQTIRHMSKKGRAAAQRDEKTTPQHWVSDEDLSPKDAEPDARMERLENLYSSGSITPQEYKKRREKLERGPDDD